MSLTHARLLEVLEYDPETGVFKNRITRGRNAMKGAIAGTLTAAGYVRMEIDGKPYRAQRLAVFYVEGKMPEKMIDHIESGKQKKANNCYSNLRQATPQVNSHNIYEPNKNNTTGLRGVRRAGSKFKATICVNRKNQHLGTFDTPQLAHDAYLAAKKKHQSTIVKNVSDKDNQ